MGDGVPSEPNFGFIPVDHHGRVDGLDGVYAAGDATNFPIKQGGLATQQHEPSSRACRLRQMAPDVGQRRDALLGGHRADDAAHDRIC